MCTNLFLNSKQLIRHIKNHGAVELRGRGKGAHRMFELNGRRQAVPTHGGGKELGPGLVHIICKNFGIPRP